MGLCFGKDRGEETQALMSNSIKVLFLGAGDSGKSTIFKQMRLIHGAGKFPSESERLTFREVVITNIIESMERLVHASLELDIPIEIEENHERFENFNNLERNVDPVKLWQNKIIREDVQKLYADPGIRKTLERKNEFHLDDSAEYFFKELDRIVVDDYIPNNKDVLMCRKKTTGIVESEFNVLDHTIKLIDVGGQRNERKKWIHVSL